MCCSFIKPVDYLTILVFGLPWLKASLCHCADTLKFAIHEFTLLLSAVHVDIAAMAVLDPICVLTLVLFTIRPSVLSMAVASIIGPLTFIFTAIRRNQDAMAMILPVDVPAVVVSATPESIAAAAMEVVFVVEAAYVDIEAIRSQMSTMDS